MQPMCRTQGPTPLWSAIWKQPAADDVAVVLAGADAVVLRSAAGAGSGVPRKDSVDRAASVLMAGRRRTGRGSQASLQISSMGANQPCRSPAPVRSGRPTSRRKPLPRTTCAPGTWTGPSHAPGHLTDAPATAKIRPAAPPVPAGPIPRADVAAVIAALLDEPGTAHQTLELVSGDSPIDAPLSAASLAYPAPGSSPAIRLPRAEARAPGAMSVACSSARSTSRTRW